MIGPADRLRALAEAAGYDTEAEFARAAGIRENTMVQHLRRNSIPKGAADLYARAGRKTGVSVDWLLYGKGKAPRGVDPQAHGEDEAAGRGLDFADSTSVTIPELEVHAMAGQGADGQFLITEADMRDAMVGQYSFPTAGFRQTFGANAGDVIIAEVLGDSMMPTLYPGQKVMVHIKDQKPTPPGIFYLWDGMGLVIKRIELIPGSSPPTLKIKSDNSKYDTYERTVDEARINGRVIMGFTRF